MQSNDQTNFRIGDQYFKSLTDLVSFYKLHYLDTTPLIRPAKKKLEKVIAKYDFESNVSFPIARAVETFKLICGYFAGKRRLKF